MQIEVTEWVKNVELKNALKPEYFAIHYRVLLTVEEVKQLHISHTPGLLNDYLEFLEDNIYQLLAEGYELCNLGLGRLAEQIEQAVLKAEADRGRGSAHRYRRRSPLTLS
jgi:hypothetical protein